MKYVFLALFALPLFGLDLVDDEVYEAKVIELEKKVSALDQGYDRFLVQLDLFSAYFNAREYNKCESLSLEMIKIAPGESYFVGNLSLAYGKQGKFDDALLAIDHYLKLGGDEMYGKMVKASWLHGLGRVKEAFELSESVEEPVENDRKLFYYGCKACYSADAGRVDDLKKYMGKLTDDEESMEFFKRDNVFDPYRREDWFKDLVGETIKKKFSV